MKIYIINPDNNKPVTIEDWRKDENPTRAQLLAIETEDGHLLCMSKSYLPGEHTFEEAQKACAAFRPLESITFRSPSRKECIDIYDARFQGLDEAIKLTSPQVKAPVAVRYCFRNFQLGNVKNAANLPLFPFRTDNW